MGRIDKILTTSINCASLFISLFFTSLMTMLPVDKNWKKTVDIRRLRVCRIPDITSNLLTAILIQTAAQILTSTLIGNACSMLN